MPQTAEKVIDHELLFREPEYQKLFADKKANFEFNHSDVKVAEIRDWTKSKEYREKNFAREALTVNPAKACQPLGAVYVANGFHKTLSFVHGSQGCVAYYRSHFSRHFKEPTSCVSSSMTEDAAVFGGLIVWAAGDAPVVEVDFEPVPAFLSEPSESPPWDFKIRRSRTFSPSFSPWVISMKSSLNSPVVTVRDSWPPGFTTTQVWALSVGTMACTGTWRTFSRCCTRI